MSFKYTAVGFDKVKVRLKSLADPLSKDEAESLGTAVVKRMKELISKGQSPIEGRGKFPAYKRPERYPGKRKAHSPVNLELSGDFLADLDSRAVRIKGGYVTEVGYQSSKQQVKEQGHRAGANRQPKRPTIPAGRGESFVQSIIAAYRKIALGAIRKR